VVIVMMEETGASEMLVPTYLPTNQPTYQTELHCKQIRQIVKCNRLKQGYYNLLHAAVVMLSTYMRNSFDKVLAGNA
jgi:hypothetical protein